MEKLRLRSQETVKRSIVNYTKMPPYCFEDCTSLTSITIPKSVTEVSNGYFKGCTSLKEVTCLAQVPPLGLGSFDNPRKITLSLYKAYSSRNVSQEKMKNPVSSLCKRTYGIYIVPRPGLEPGWIAPLVFETSASTDSAIWAFLRFRRVQR